MAEQAAVSSEKRIYNSRLVYNYIEYLELRYPNLDIDSMLKYAGIQRYEVEDPAFWFTQRQLNCFHEILALKTGDPNISREAGRFAASSHSSSTLKKYALGFISPHAAYRLVANIASQLTRGMSMSVKKLGPNSVEVTAVASHGTVEMTSQCENRLGMMEALGRIFTGKFSSIEHPECMHRGHKSCRYVITWEAMPSFTWRRFGKYAAFGTASIAFLLFFVLPEHWAIYFLFGAMITLSISLYSATLEKREMAKSLEMQGDAARERLDEINIRYNHARLVQEIGQVASTILDPNELMGAFAEAMRQHLGFDRGVIMLANKTKTRLTFNAGYGYSKEQEKILEETEFNLENVQRA